MHHTNRKFKQQAKRARLEREAEEARHAELKSQRDEQMRKYGDEPERLPDVAEKDGDSGEALGSRRYLRSNSRFVADVISCGVITKETAESLIRGQIGVIAECIKRGNARDARAAWAPVFAGCKIEYDYNAMNRHMLPIRPTPAASDGEQIIEQMASLAYLEQPNLSQQAETAAIFEDYGISWLAGGTETTVEE